MKRSKKRGRRGATPVEAGSSLVIGGITLGSTRRPPAGSRAGAGRLGRAMRKANKKTKPRSLKSSSAQSRWENEGGKTQKPAAAATGASKQPLKKSRAPKAKRAEFPVPLPPDRGRQRRAKARAKGAQIKQAGLESRLLGHVSGSGKRKQARRDAKNG